jgi:hypothetical protein
LQFRNSRIRVHLLYSTRTTAAPHTKSNEDDDALAEIQFGAIQSGREHKKKMIFFTFLLFKKNIEIDFEHSFASFHVVIFFGHVSKRWSFVFKEVLTTAFFLAFIWAESIFFSQLLSIQLGRERERKK